MKIPEILRLEVERAPGNLASVLKVVGDAGLVIESLEAVRRTPRKTHWELALEMQASGEAMALVVDEFGAVSGLVTPSDLLAELVGDHQAPVVAERAPCDQSDTSPCTAAQSAPASARVSRVGW